MPVLNLSDATNAFRQLASEIGISVPASISAGLPNTMINTIMDEGEAGIEKVRQQLVSQKSNQTNILSQTGSISDYAKEVQDVLNSLYPEQSSLGEAIATQVKSRINADTYTLPENIENYYSQVAKSASADRGFLYSGESGRSETELLSRLAMEQYNTDINTALSLSASLPNAITTGAGLRSGDLSALLNQYNIDVNADLTAAQTAATTAAQKEDDGNLFEDIAGTVLGSVVGNVSGGVGQGISTALLNKIFKKSSTVVGSGV